jgi:ectoine hydroxylase-related dioxygenase (phytanoyl-CoA dioxygenase family)
MAVTNVPAPTQDLDELLNDMARSGYALVADALAPEQMEAMTARFEEQAIAEARQRGEELSMDDEHLWVSQGALLNKGRIWQDLIDPDSVVFEVVSATLAPSVDARLAEEHQLHQKFILSSLDALFKRRERTANESEGSVPHEGLVYHTDSAFLPGHLDFPIVVNSFFCLTDYTPENGSTLVVPGTHETAPPHWGSFDGEGAVAIEAPAGTCLVVDGRTWHAAGRNSDGELRGMASAVGHAPWVRQRWNFATNLRQDVIDQLSDAQKRMVGLDTMLQGPYGAFVGLNIIEPTLGRENVSHKAPQSAELHLN